MESIMKTLLLTMLMLTGTALGQEVADDLEVTGIVQVLSETVSITTNVVEKLGECDCNSTSYHTTLLWPPEANTSTKMHMSDCAVNTIGEGNKTVTTTVNEITVLTLKWKGKTHKLTHTRQLEYVIAKFTKKEKWHKVEEVVKEPKGMRE
jgi:hypothetical protein